MGQGSSEQPAKQSGGSAADLQVRVTSRGSSDRRERDLGPAQGRGDDRAGNGYPRERDRRQEPDDSRRYDRRRDYGDYERGSREERRASREDRWDRGDRDLQLRAVPRDRSYQGSSVGSIDDSWGPQSDTSSMSGLRSVASRSSAARRENTPSDFNARSASLRLREETDFTDHENDKQMYLRRLQEHVDHAEHDEELLGAVKPLPPPREPPRRRGPSSDGGYSDTRHDRHQGKQRVHGHRSMDTQSERSGRSSLSSFRSAVSGASNRYLRRGGGDRGGRRRDSRDGRSSGRNSPRADSYYSARDYDDRDRRSPRDYYDDRDRRSPRDNYGDRYTSRDRYNSADRYDERPLALRDRDDVESIGRESRSSRRSLSRGHGEDRLGSVGAEARGPGRGVVPVSRRGPGMANWVPDRREENTTKASFFRSHPEAGSHDDDFSVSQLRVDDAGMDDLTSRDLEAKITHAHKVYEAATQELEDMKKEMAQMAAKDKHKDMPGGNVVQHKLMADLADLRDYCIELEKTKAAEETRAKEIAQQLLREEDQRRDDANRRQECEKKEEELRRRIDELTDESKQCRDKLVKDSRDNDEIRQLMQMVEEERNQTLDLLRKAVAQKDQMKAEIEQNTAGANDKIHRIERNQKTVDNKIRELLGNVDTLVSRFSDGHQEVRGNVKMQLELIKVRDNVRNLLRQDQQKT